MSQIPNLYAGNPLVQFTYKPTYENICRAANLSHRVSRYRPFHFTFWAGAAALALQLIVWDGQGIWMLLAYIVSIYLWSSGEAERQIRTQWKLSQEDTEVLEIRFHEDGWLAWSHHGAVGQSPWKHYTHYAEDAFGFAIVSRLNEVTCFPKDQIGSEEHCDKLRSLLQQKLVPQRVR